MKREVRFTPLAAKDIEEAFEWYESQRVGLGSEFEAVVDQMVRLLTEMPELGPELHGDLRRVLLVRFPYALYYRLGDLIEVRGCLHLRRSPAIPRRRA